MNNWLDKYEDEDPGPAINMQKWIKRTAGFEGFEPNYYSDDVGKLTIGYGFNLEAPGTRKKLKEKGLDVDGMMKGTTSITEEQALPVLSELYIDSYNTARKKFSNFDKLPEDAQHVLTDMVYNLGETRIGQFKKLKAAIERNDYKQAAAEIQNSKYASQTGNRARTHIATFNTLGLVKNVFDKSTKLTGKELRQQALNQGQQSYVPVNTAVTPVPVIIPEMTSAPLYGLGSHVVHGGPRWRYVYDNGGPVKSKSMLSAESDQEDTELSKDSFYNMERAKQLYTPDERGHWPSVDYETGEWLKSKKHPTAWMEYLYGYILNPLQAIRYNVMPNVYGYFGEDTLQYVPKQKTGGPLPKAKDGGDMPFGMPLKEVNPFTVAEYRQPMMGNFILPDPNRPELMNTGATEYKIGVDADGREIQIPTVVSGQYLGPNGAVERAFRTREAFLPMTDPGSYSKFYDMVNKLGIMKQKTYGLGGMIKRADGSYSKRGLWDNIRANKGSGKKPTKEMLKQERKIRAAEKKENGGPVRTAYIPQADQVHIAPEDRNDPAIMQHELFHRYQNMVQDSLRLPQYYQGPIRRPSAAHASESDVVGDYYNRRNVDTEIMANEFYGQPSNASFGLIPQQLVYDKVLNPMLYATPWTAEGEAQQFEDAYRRGEVDESFLKPLAYRYGAKVTDKYKKVRSTVPRVAYTEPSNMYTGPTTQRGITFKDGGRITPSGNIIDDFINNL